MRNLGYVVIADFRKYMGQTVDDKTKNGGIKTKLVPPDKKNKNGKLWV